MPEWLLILLARRVNTTRTLPCVSSKSGTSTAACLGATYIPTNPTQDLQGRNQFYVTNAHAHAFAVHAKHTSSIAAMLPNHCICGALTGLKILWDVDISRFATLSRKLGGPS